MNKTSSRSLLGTLLGLTMLAAGPTYVDQKPSNQAVEVAPTHPAYRLGADDVITVTVYNHTDLSDEFTIYPDGSIVYPLLGQTRLEGLTAAEGKALIRSRLEQDYLYEANVSVSVKEYRSQKVTIFGNVAKPGSYYLYRPLRLLDLLVEADGVTQGPTGKARIVRSRAEPTKQRRGDVLEALDVDLEELIAGDSRANILLSDGDLVYVLKAAEMVHVIGEVLRPGSFPYQENMTVLKLITLAGGKNPKAAPNHVVALRPQNGEVVEIRLAPDDVVEPEDMIKVKKSFF